MIEYWRHHRRLESNQVKSLFIHTPNHPWLTDIYAMAGWLHMMDELSIRHTIDNRCKDNHYSWCMYDMDGYEIDNLVGLS